MRSTWIAMLAGALALGACGETGPDVKSAFEAEVPKSWQLRGFKLTVTEDTGTKVEPRRQSRYEAQLAPRADLYRTIAAFDEKEVVELTAKKGKTATAHGTATSGYVAGVWKTYFEEETAPYRLDAKERELGENAILFGSKDYQKFLAGLQTDLAGMEAAEQLENDQIAAIGEARRAAQQEAASKRQQLNEAYRAAYEAGNAKQYEVRRIFNEKNQAIRERYNAEQQQRYAVMRAALEDANRAARGTPNSSALRQAARAKYDDDYRALEAEIKDRQSKEAEIIKAELDEADRAARAAIEAAQNARNANSGQNNEDVKLQNQLQQVYEARNRRYQRAAELQQIIARLEAHKPVH